MRHKAGSTTVDSSLNSSFKRGGSDSNSPQSNTRIRQRDAHIGHGPRYGLKMSNTHFTTPYYAWMIAAPYARHIDFSRRERGCAAHRQAQKSGDAAHLHYGIRLLPIEQKMGEPVHTRLMPIEDVIKARSHRTSPTPGYTTISPPAAVAAVEDGLSRQMVASHMGERSQSLKPNNALAPTKSWSAPPSTHPSQPPSARPSPPPSACASPLRRRPSLSAPPSARLVTSSS